MKKKVSLNKKENRLVDSILNTYNDQDNLERLKTLQSALVTCFSESEELKPHIHFLKTRLKDADSLRKKLERKILDAKKEGESYEITPENLFAKINDLIGVRILHLYTDQIKIINPIMKKLFDNHGYRLSEGPFARTWDDEYKDFFLANEIKTESSRSLYTSVHYIIGAGRTSNELTAEIQVRTLMEEVWGEVDHQINYPVKTEILSCEEQIKVLARVTSSATRLVDSIFRCKKDAEA